MRLSYLVGSPDVRAMSLGWAGDLDQILGRLAAIGYDGVEVQVRDPAAFNGKALGRQIQAAGLAISGIGTGQVGVDDRLYLVVADADARRRAVERFGAILELAAEYGVDMAIGRARGQLKAAPDRATGLAWFHAALDTLVPRAEQLGVRIVLEPQTRFNTDFLNTFTETIALIERYNSRALVFEGDTFHMAYEERSIPAALVTGVRSGLMTYVQLGDSNRLAPGWGGLNWADIIATLQATGYDGWLALEYYQQPDNERAARQGYTLVRSLLDAPAF